MLIEWWTQTWCYRILERIDILDEGAHVSVQGCLTINKGVRNALDAL